MSITQSSPDIHSSLTILTFWDYFGCSEYSIYVRVASWIALPMLGIICAQLRVIQIIQTHHALLSSSHCQSSFVFHFWQLWTMASLFNIAVKDMGWSVRKIHICYCCVEDLPTAMTPLCLSWVAAIFLRGEGTVTNTECLHMIYRSRWFSLLLP